MAKMTAKKALLTSILSLLVCVTMLVGTTFAWFTDSVTSGTNKIIAGNLDVNAYYYAGNKTTAEEIEADTLNWLPVQNSESIFSQDLWESGHTEIAYLKIVNEGTLAFKYTVNVSPVNEVGGVNVAGESFKLSNYMAFAVTAPSETYTAYTRDTARAAIDPLVVTAAVNGQSTSLTDIQSNANRTDKALLAGKTEYIAVIVYMPEEVGNVANYKKGTTAPEIDLGISIYAAQYTKEEDSFGDDYDANANNAGNDVIEYNYFPQVVQSAQLKKSATEGKAEKDGEDNNVTENAVANTITINSAAKVDNVASNESAASVTISNESIAFDEESSVATVTLNVVKDDEADQAFIVENDIDVNTKETTTYEVNLTVEGGDFKKNTTDETKYEDLITVSMYIGKGKTGLVLYHNGNVMTAKDTLAGVIEADNYYYDSASGYVTMKVDHFSPFTAVYDAPVASIGTTAYYSLSEAVNAVAANGTIEILRDITLTEKIVVDKAVTVSLNGNSIVETDFALVPFADTLFTKTYADEKIIFSAVEEGLVITAEDTDYAIVRDAENIDYVYYTDGNIYIYDTSAYTGTTFVVPEKVNGLGGSSFKYNNTITKLVLTKQLDYAFKALQGNSSITAVDFGEMTYIPNRMFYGCTGIINLEIPASVKRIEDWAFYGNNSIQMIVAKDLEYVGYKAFDACSALRILDIGGENVAIMGWAGRQVSAIEKIYIRGENATVNLGYAPSGEAKGSFVFCKTQQSGNPNTMVGVEMYVANDTVANQFSAEIGTEGATAKYLTISVSTAEELKSAITNAGKAGYDYTAIAITQNITVSEKWDERYGGKTSADIIIDGKGHTLKFTGEVNDGGNWFCVFRLEGAATVKNLTFDLSEATGVSNRLRAISAKSDLTVDNCVFIGNTAVTNDRAVIFGEGQSAAQVNASVTITNSTFTNWRRGISDNENAKDFKSVVVVGNTFNNSNVGVSAYDSVVFNGNTLNNGYVQITSYSAAATVKTEALENVVDANLADDTWIWTNTEYTTAQTEIGVYAK